jgi:glutathione synthase/RimK-type ligase-like ATP-grasp enzyme
VAGAILIVSHAHDTHALHVLERLRQRGADAHLFDTGRLPRETRLTIAHDPNGWSASAFGDGEEIDLTNVRAVWWRRPQPFALHAELIGPEDQAFALAETAAAVAGLWALLDAEWINDPDKDERAARKAWQLRVARECGIPIPRTLITNDPARARMFIESEDGNVVYKAFQGSERTWRETRVLKPAELDLVDSVRFAPIIFQQFVPAQADLRITIVGDRIFAAAIECGQSRYPVDFRMDIEDVPITATDLPSSVEEKLRALMARLRLVYGAVDMRLTPEGEHVFLEINPAGQWLFVEARTGQSISEALADELVQLAS